VSVPPNTIADVTRLRWYLVVTALAAGVSYALQVRGWALVIVTLGSPLLLVVLMQFLRGALTGLRTASPREDADGRAAAMSGTEFEDYVAGVARSCGVPVIMTPLSGDWGVDLIVGRRPHRLAIQCKRSARPVGPAAVQEVVAGAPMQDCTQTMVVSNQTFTAAAQRLAELHGCVLVGGPQLAHLRAVIRSHTAPVRPPTG